MAAASSTVFAEVVNSALLLVNRSTQSRVTVSFPALFGVTAGSSNFFSDPRVVFDELTGQFVVTALLQTGTLTTDGTLTVQSSQLYYAVSTNGNPSASSSFVVYHVNVTETTTGSPPVTYVADFDNVGYNHDAYVVTVNMFNTSTTAPFGSFDHPRVVAIDKANLSTGISQHDAPSVVTRSMTPSRMHGSVAGDPMWFVSDADGASIIITREDNALNSTWTFSSSKLAVNPYTLAPATNAYGYSVPQYGSASNLRVLDDRFSAPAATNTIQKVQPTDPPSWQLVAAQTVQVGTVVEARWYQLNVSGNPNLAPVVSVTQEGQTAPGVTTTATTAASSMFDPAIDFSKSGAIMVAYLEAGPNEYLTSWVVNTADRQPSSSSTQPGVLLQPGTFVQGGAAPYIDGASNRTGDYVSLAQDPLTTGSVVVGEEYATPGIVSLNYKDNWGTVLAQVSNAVTYKQLAEQLYIDLLGRQGDTSGLNYWAGQINVHGVGYVAQQFMISTEYLGDLVTQAYETYLGRVPDASGKGYWVLALQRGATVEQLKAGLVGSSEYFVHAGNNVNAYVTQVYSDILFRAPDSTGFRFGHIT
jgi:hypothetical protein